MQKWNDDLIVMNHFSLVYNKLELLMLRKKEEVQPVQIINRPTQGLQSIKNGIGMGFTYFFLVIFFVE